MKTTPTHTIPVSNSKRQPQYSRMKLVGLIFASDSTEEKYKGPKIRPKIDFLSKLYARAIGTKYAPYKGYNISDHEKQQIKSWLLNFEEYLLNPNLRNKNIEPLIKADFLKWFPTLIGFRNSKNKTEIICKLIIYDSGISRFPEL